MADTTENLDNSGSLNPPITMKVDAPAEEDKTAGDNEKNAKNEEFKTCTPDRIPVTSVTTNPFATSQNKLATRGILKPPQLSLNNANNSAKPAVILNPSRLNPFAKPTNDGAKEESKTVQLNGETPKFVPLVQTEPKTNSTQPVVTTASTTLSTTSFVFGQNLQDRVVGSDAKADEPKPSTSLNSNGTSEMLFSSAIKSEGKTDGTITSKETKSLSESAREYEESRANKRKYEEVEIITGEENETNILNINCKLFAFDKASGSWQERGRGVLRLNDFEGEGHAQSRLLFRTTGIWRVILNTKIWAEMTVEQASEKSVRFTAMDPQGVIKVFLVMASIEDSKQLYSQIQLRVQKEIAAQKHKKLNVDKDSGGN
ncbi:ran-binding protein 3 isoform X2 [Tribolium castaneum]|uniref:ran-binding protein 3 isoform X2 n=1 Tax=Tribolium castaneum TaxID=7070 RepID=UPI00046C35AB|nr:PREDICTED: ran-binding protein 3 isoform X2 [Tribolium castaneum]|eukprot:XP_008198201.1 PREDICTED: ran-binding protein 3 isoform X2 [Tribolium castaneum]